MGDEWWENNKYVQTPLATWLVMVLAHLPHPPILPSVLRVFTGARGYWWIYQKETPKHDNHVLLEWIVEWSRAH